MIKFRLEGHVVVHLAKPRFRLAPVDGPADPRLVEPLAGCVFFDDRQFGVIEWIDQPEGFSGTDVEHLARLAAEFGWG